MCSPTNINIGGGSRYIEGDTMGDCTPEQFLNQVEKSRKALMAKRFDEMPVRVRALEAARRLEELRKQRFYLMACSEKKKLLRAQIATDDLRNWIHPK